MWGLVIFRVLLSKPTGWLYWVRQADPEQGHGPRGECGAKCTAQHHREWPNSSGFHSIVSDWEVYVTTKNTLVQNTRKSYACDFRAQ